VAGRPGAVFPRRLTNGEHLRVHVVETPEAAGRLAATALERAIRQGALTLGLATGSSMLPCYAELVHRHRERGLTFADVRAFLLDEYVGVAVEAPQSYRAFIREHLADHVELPASSIFSPRGDTADSAAEAGRFESLIAHSPPDIQLLGIGRNGHLAFTEPGSALDTTTRIVELAPATREDNARFFGHVDEVPRQAITQGLGTILRSSKLLLVADGGAKAEALARALRGPVDRECPASILHLHTDVTVIADLEAASLLNLDAAVVNGQQEQDS
jgi:glucosamine-6-phosphate deaminase